MKVLERTFGKVLTKAEFADAVFWPRAKQYPPVHAALFGTILCAALLIIVVGGALWMEAAPNSTGTTSLAMAAIVTPLAGMVIAMFKFTENMHAAHRESDYGAIKARGDAQAVVENAKKAPVADISSTTNIGTGAGAGAVPVTPAIADAI